MSSQINQALTNCINVVLMVEEEKKLPKQIHIWFVYNFFDKKKKRGQTFISEYVREIE